MCCLDPVDERLASGEPSASSLELTLRAEHLRSRPLRQSLAQALEEQRRRATDCDEATDLVLARLADRLRCSGEVDPRGVALARLLLHGEHSPLRGGGPWHGALHEAQAAYEALGAPITVGGSRW